MSSNKIEIKFHIFLIIKSRNELCNTLDNTNQTK